MHDDLYPSFSALVAREPVESYAITVHRGSNPAVAIIAPHGGQIEPGTSALTRAIAGCDYSYYLFEGRKAEKNRDLHVTSHHFDEPQCLALISDATTVLAIHGCRGENAINVGGLDARLADDLCYALRSKGFPTHRHGHAYPAHQPMNICNRGARRAGAQLELTMDMRQAMCATQISAVVREVLAQAGGM
ncbi:poly-gamma-glutamate hydrolase family protein [Lysobacter enzymogenes]|uniref:poly-gamma-glutamate hydrolase family protein n=1 Tax=Lysobacter enzymogenes TaxID=69 RepID=UPI000944B9E9|nr:poly-gamma-glutamate hydrolase family protein [Lysobacter enzymogenes]